MSNTPRWASEDFWRKLAIWVTAGMFVVLIILTKAWLDPAWGAEVVREQLMINFLIDPTSNARGFGTTRRMPKLGITEEEARGLVAFLKWTAAIDTNGFPRNFTPIAQEGDQ